MTKRIQYGITLSFHDSGLLERKAQRDGVAPSKLAGELVGKALRRQLGPVPKAVAEPKAVEPPTLEPAQAHPEPAPAPPSLAPDSPGIAAPLRPEVPIVPRVEAKVAAVKQLPAIESPAAQPARPAVPTAETKADKEKQIPVLDGMWIRVPTVVTTAITSLAKAAKHSNEWVFTELIAAMLGCMTKESALLMLRGELVFQKQIELLKGIEEGTQTPILTSEAYEIGLGDQLVEQGKARPQPPETPMQAFLRADLARYNQTRTLAKEIEEDDQRA